MMEIIPVEKLSSAKDNPRRKVGDVKELAASIEAVGILEPLVVTPDGDGGHVVVAGARRLAAAKKAGLDEVPCVVREFDDAQRTEAMLIENLQRADLAPLEEASGFRRLIDDHGFSQRRLGERIGRSQAHVSKRLALLALPKEAQKALDNGGITLEEGLELTKLKDMPKRQAKAWKDSQSQSWMGVSGAVENQLAEHKRAEKRGKVVERLKKQGIRILEKRPGADARNLSPFFGFDHVDAKAHEKEACHAVRVEERYDDVEVVPYCTEPKNHPRPTESKEAKRKETATERRGRLHWEALKEARERRWAFVKGLVNGRLPKKETDELICRALIGVHGDMWDLIEEVEYLLDIPDLENEEEKGPLYDDGLVARRWVEEGGDLRTAAIAVAFASEESNIAARWGGGWDQAGPYFDFLKAHGYEVSKAEELELAGKAPS